MIRLQGEYNIQRTPAALSEPFKAGRTAGSEKMINQDKVSIRADSRQIMETEFAHSAAEAILMEVRGSTSEQKLADLERQIAEGSYQVNTAAVAEKIFRYGGLNPDGQIE